EVGRLQHTPDGFGREPCSCGGGPDDVSGGPAMVASSVMHSGCSTKSIGPMGGSSGMAKSGREKLNAEVMSPTAARRQSDRCRTSTPNRVSRKRNVEV